MSLNVVQVSERRSKVLPEQKDKMCSTISGGRIWKIPKIEQISLIILFKTKIFVIYHRLQAHHGLEQKFP
jgi:hypothetical protein